MHELMLRMPTSELYCHGQFAHYLQLYHDVDHDDDDDDNGNVDDDTCGGRFHDIFDFFYFFIFFSLFHFDLHRAEQPNWLIVTTRAL